MNEKVEATSRFEKKLKKNVFFKKSRWVELLFRSEFDASNDQRRLKKKLIKVVLRRDC